LKVPTVHVQTSTLEQVGIYSQTHQFLVRKDLSTHPESARWGCCGNWLALS